MPNRLAAARTVALFSMMYSASFCARSSILPFTDNTPHWDGIAPTGGCICGGVSEYYQSRSYAMPRASWDTALTIAT